MAEIKYNNGVGTNNQYDFRFFDKITDPNNSFVDILVSPDEIKWFFKKDIISTTVNMTLLGQDNLSLLGNQLTTNKSIIE